MSDVAPSADAGLKIAKQRPSRYTTYVFVVMFSINFLNYMDRYVFTGAASVIGPELNLGVDQVGFIASAFLIVYTLATIPFGIWADRTKRKNVIALCVAIWSVATAFTALAGNFISLFLSRMLLGVGEAGYFPAGTALLSDYYSRAKRARIMSRWSTGSLVGLMVGFVIGGVVAGTGYGNWRLAFLFTGIPGLVLAFLAWRMREPRRNEADEEDQQVAPAADGSIPAVPESETFQKPPLGRAIRDFFALLHIKSLVVLIVVQIFAFFAQGASVTFLPIYLHQKDTLNLTSGQAATLSGVVVVVAGIIGTILGGYMADMLNRRHPGARILVCGIGFLLCAPCFALAVTVQSSIAFMVFFFLSAMLILLYSGPSTAAIQDVVPSLLRASAVAVSLLLAHLLGDAFAPSFIGVLANMFDPTHGGHFHNLTAGHDLARALLITCVPALVLAGLVGIFGARWMKSDINAAQEADRLAREQRAG